jgi:molecular chaperone DnaK
LDGIPPAPRGVPQIEVSFDIDANGILSVKAQDKATHKEQSIKITSSSGLSDSEIQRMKHEAEEHAAEDAARREEVELRNGSDQKVFQTRKQIEELKEQLDDAARTRLEDAARELEEALKGTDLALLRQRAEALDKAWEAVSSELYQKAQAAGPAGPGAGAGFGGQAGGQSGETAGKDKAVEADFEVMDDKK